MLVLIWPPCFDANKHALTSLHSLSVFQVEFTDVDFSCLSHRKAALRACSLDPSLRLLLSLLLFCPSRASLMFLCQFLSFSWFSFPASSSLVWRGHLLQSSCALRSTPQHSCDVPWMLSYHVPKAVHALHKCASGNAFSLSQRRYYFCHPCL